jgi:hypothetical protein
MNRTTRRLAAASLMVTAGLGIGMTTRTVQPVRPAGATAIPTVIGEAACIEKIDDVIVECGRVVRTNAETLLSTPLVAGKSSKVHGRPDNPQPTVNPQVSGMGGQATPEEQMIVHEDPAPEGVRTVPTPVDEGTCQS